MGYSDSFSDYCDEPVSKKKKPKKYSDDDYSDDVNKKDSTKNAGPSKRTLNKRKKAAKNKGKWAAFDDLDKSDDEPEPVKKSAPTMSDDSDSEEVVRSKPQKNEEPKKNVNLWDALMDDSESEEDDGGFDFGEPMKKESTLSPVEVKSTPNWKKKKEKKKEKEEEEDEFDFFKEEPKKLSKAQLKRQRQKERKEAEEKAAEAAKTQGLDVNQEKEKTEQPVDPDKPPEGLSKAALKRWKKKHKKQEDNKPKQLTE